jgi:O-methyltransferase
MADVDLTAARSQDLATRYLDLVKRSVSHSQYGRTALAVHRPRNRLKRVVTDELGRRGLALVEMHEFREDVEGVGKQWPVPAFAQTMVGHVRLDHVQECVEQILADDVPGDMIETGIWRGGTGIFTRAVLAARGVTDRVVWLADSFEGLPPPDADSYPVDTDSMLHEIDSLGVSMEEVESHFRRYGLLDVQVRLVKGWFRDTLPSLKNHTWSLIRLDGDLYESTMDGLQNLYQGLSKGGYVIVDDYYAYEPCKVATDDFRRDAGIDEPLERVDWTAVSWRKT